MTSHIRIPDVSPVAQAMADGARTVFSFPFPIFAADDLEVRANSTLVTSGYAVVGEGSSTGGAVIFTDAPANGVRVTLRRRQAYARTDDFLNERAPTPHELNDAVDQNVAALQELAEEVSRAVKRPLSADLAQPVDLSLPTPEAGKVIGWNETAGGLVNIDQLSSADALLKSQNLADLPDKAAARGNLGLANVAASGSYADLADKPNLGSAVTLDLDADGTLAANSDSRLPSQKAVKTYVDAKVASTSPGLHLQAFTTSDTFTVPAGATSSTAFKFTLVGGGGGGGCNTSSQSHGGGGGATAIYLVSGLTPNQTISVAVGSGGQGGQSNGNDGTAGGASTVTIGGTTVTAGGGGGGAASQSGAYVTSGGTATNGTINIAGGMSQCGQNSHAANGGSSTMGNGGSYAGGVGNQHGTGYGGGGGGTAGGSPAGNGTQGIVMVEWVL